MTFENSESVDRVLCQSFHQLDGKKVIVSLKMATFCGARSIVYVLINASGECVCNNDTEVYMSVFLIID